MRVLLPGATGMVGQGVLRECLLDSDVASLGVSAARMTEQAYPRVTFDLTLSTAAVLAMLDPAMTFIYPGSAPRSCFNSFLSATITPIPPRVSSPPGIQRPLEAAT